MGNGIIDVTKKFVSVCSKEHARHVTTSAFENYKNVFRTVHMTTVQVYT